MLFPFSGLEQSVGPCALELCLLLISYLTQHFLCQWFHCDSFQHAKIQTYGGTGADRIPLYSVRPLSAIVLLVCRSLSCFSCSTSLYSLLTVKMLFFYKKGKPLVSFIRNRVIQYNSTGQVQVQLTQSSQNQN
jgi:hypothetical protein